MCRYVLATPQNAADTNHNLRVIFGNGLRPQIWPQFVNRFKIPHVVEFYGATEGNANIGKYIHTARAAGICINANLIGFEINLTVNITNVVGAIGFVSRIIPSVYPTSVIKADQDTGEPIRDSNGLCQVNAPMLDNQVAWNPSSEWLI